MWWKNFVFVEKQLIYRLKSVYYCKIVFKTCPKITVIVPQKGQFYSNSCSIDLAIMYVHTNQYFIVLYYVTIPGFISMFVLTTNTVWIKIIYTVKKKNMYGTL